MLLPARLFDVLYYVPGIHSWGQQHLPRFDQLRPPMLASWSVCWGQQMQLLDRVGWPRLRGGLEVSVSILLGARPLFGGKW